MCAVIAAPGSMLFVCMQAHACVLPHSMPCAATRRSATQGWSTAAHVLGPIIYRCPSSSHPPLKQYCNKSSKLSHTHPCGSEICQPGQAAVRQRSCPARAERHSQPLSRHHLRPDPALAVAWGFIHSNKAISSVHAGEKMREENQHRAHPMLFSAGVSDRCACMQRAVCGCIGGAHVSTEEAAW